ncbi:MAG: prepilin peptidase [Parvibaculales bacterium]
MESLFNYGIAFLLGACLGSFANVVALRTLARRDWLYQPSVCFACQRRLTIIENVPFFGYLRRAGYCRCGAHRLPTRYILVELALAALMVLAYSRFGGLNALILMPFLVLLVIIFLTDLDDFIIPDWASLGGVGLALLFAFIGAFMGAFIDVSIVPNIKTALFGGLAGFALIYGINLIYRMVRGHDGIGLGDVKLMAMLGAWLGPASLLPILFLASVAGAFWGIVSIVLQRYKTNKDGFAIQPFGCFLVVAALLWLFFAPDAVMMTQ